MIRRFFRTSPASSPLRALSALVAGLACPVCLVMALRAASPAPGGGDPVTPVVPASAAAPVAAGPPASAAAEPRIGLVRLDPARRQVSFEAEVCLREGMLEFLICAWDTKKHESILHTKARASHLHAALLLLGLSAGKPARWSGEDEDARFLPPAGAGLEIALLWKDKDGKLKRAEAFEWIRGAQGRKFTPPKEWVFVGSDILPDGRYWGELEGEVVSVSNFASAVIDVPFESSNKDAMRDMCANTAAIPPVGTKVDVIVTALPNAEKAPHARATLEIDAFGRMSIDGQPIDLDQLEKWAVKDLQRHEKGMVVIRADGRALVHDVERAHQQLRIGGIRDFLFQRVPPEDELLPRTPQQAEKALKEWRDIFANWRDQIREPGEQAQRVLDQIELQTRLLEGRKNLLREYAAHLREAMKEYRASTQPAGGAAEPAPGGR